MSHFSDFSHRQATPSFIGLLHRLPSGRFIPSDAGMEKPVFQEKGARAYVSVPQ